MKIEELKRTEHLALSIEIGLTEFCNRFENLLELPKMTSDFENETEWSEIDFNGINYNVSKPYNDGTLSEWDSTVPENCNFGISIGVSKNNSSFSETDIARIGNLLSSEFETKVYYYRTWLGIGENEKRNLIFEPKKNET